MITKIDANTIKETTERIIDLIPLKDRITAIDLEIAETQKQPEMVFNDFKQEKLNKLEEEKKQIQESLNNYLAVK